MDLQLDKNSISKILNELWTRNQGKGAQSTLVSRFKSVVTALDARYPQIDNYGQKAYLWVNDLDSVPLCYCGQPTIWKSYTRGYGEYCGIKCMSKCPVTLQKKSATVQNRYGVSHFSKTELYKTKFKNTCMDRYGVINPGQIVDLKIRRSKTKSQTYLLNLIHINEHYYTPLFEYAEFQGVHESSMWRCVKCKTDFEMCNLIQGIRCSSCYPKTRLVGESKQEIEIADWLKSLNISVERKNRTLLNGKELDLLIPDHNLAIEVCGSYWHSDRFVDKLYHQQKTVQCELQNIQLITLFDFDLKNQNIVKDMILHKLGLSTKKKFMPRQGSIQQINSQQAKEFNNLYHLRAHAAASHHFGFFVNDELIAVSSWSKSRFDKNSHALELVRLCSKNPVSGLLGKMTHYASKVLNAKTIHSYVDLRYGSGSSYQSAGYNLIRTTKPGYWYVDGNATCYHRSSFAKSNLTHFPNYDQNKTEFEIMNELGYHRIWDCGNKLYEWKL